MLCVDYSRILCSTGNFINRHRIYWTVVPLVLRQLYLLVAGNLRPAIALGLVDQLTLSIQVEIGFVIVANRASFVFLFCLAEGLQWPLAAFGEVAGVSLSRLA